MPPLSSAERAAALLRRKLSVVGIFRRLFPLGPGSHDEIITTNRLILILKGRLRYTVENQSWMLETGCEFLVPAWVRRVWTVANEEPCELIWCEFDEHGVEAEPASVLMMNLAGGSMQKEAAAFRQLARLHERLISAGEPWPELRLESELKVMLIRFFESAERFEPAGAVSTGKALHPSIKTALRWVSEHFHEPNVLEDLFRESAMSRNYFRSKFTEAMQCSPHEYIEKLRLRRARYLLHETNWQLKRIAMEVGYEDQLYFSKIYRRFWKRSPSEERESIG